MVEGDQPPEALGLISHWCTCIDTGWRGWSGRKEPGVKKVANWMSRKHLQSTTGAGRCGTELVDRAFPGRL